ncbi:MAG TPA: CHAD domain-containing protein [Gemmatimonadaceae bacterium]|nr:CHAD domain-containing protein [Gemmatimonadaceae bacterium]
MTPRLDWDTNTDGAQRAARVVALRALDVAADAYDRMRSRDADSIHDFRVALRRLRSWIRLYRPCLDDTVRVRTRRRLNGIAAATRDLRDLDVQITWLKSERSALGDYRLEAATWVMAELKRDRKPAWQKLRKLLRRDFIRTERALRKELSRYVTVHDIRDDDGVASMRAVTASVLGDQVSALAAAFDRIRSADDARRLHRARILAKRARYVLEALSAQIPALAPVADELARFQDVVGELRDAQLLAHRVAREVTSVAAERTALVASELVYRPSGAMDFTRVTADSPFDASLSLLFARLHDRISAAERGVTASLTPDARGRLVASLEKGAKHFGNDTA